MGSMSLARRKRLAIKKREKAIQSIIATCVVCMTTVSGRTRPQAQAAITAHYQRVHPEIIAAGGVPVLR